MTARISSSASRDRNAPRARSAARSKPSRVSAGREQTAVGLGGDHHGDLPAGQRRPDVLAHRSDELRVAVIELNCVLAALSREVLRRLRSPGQCTRPRRAAGPASAAAGRETATSCELAAVL
jgi:hypothetical protein